MSRLWPRSLAGQLAALVALALFAAQAVNLGILLHERARLRIAQAAEPAAARIVDALERSARGRGPVADRGRVRLLPGDPTGGRIAEPAVIDTLRATLAEAGVRVGAIHVATAPLTASGAYRRLIARRGGHRLHSAQVLLIAVELPGRGWLVQRLFRSGDGGGIVWRLIAQTLILYAVVLVPVLWLGRRISRPLAQLTEAAERFGAGDDAAPVAIGGPRDVAATIAAFDALRARVRAMLEEKDRMLGALAHDLRTPLASLRVRVESVEVDTDRERMIETIAEMNRTLDDILSLARAGRPSEPAVDTDLAALVDAVVEDFRDLGQDVTYVEAPRLPMRLRPTLMRRALRNLIENAVNYGGSAAVGVEASATTAAITVADRGPGIPTERLEAVFDAFTRLETSRNRDTGGIGLGLALARAIARDAGGDVRLANRPGGGLVATIALPRDPAINSR